MGASTLTTELVSLISAALLLVVGVILLGLWASVCLLSRRGLKITFAVCGTLVAVDGIFGLAGWIVLIVERKEIPDAVLLATETVIAVGFACWGVVLCTQVPPKSLCVGTDGRLRLLWCWEFMLRGWASLMRRGKFGRRIYRPWR
jgi:hypothetical protein